MCVEIVFDVFWVFVVVGQVIDSGGFVEVFDVVVVMQVEDYQGLLVYGVYGQFVWVDGWQVDDD